MEQNMTTKKCIGLTVLALSLVLSLPAYAQNSPAMPPSLPGTGMEHGRHMKPDIRQERERIRKEHEALESAHKQLKAKCANDSKEQVAACRQERKELLERAEKLREQKKAVHEKHRERMEHREDRREEIKEKLMKHEGSPGGMMENHPAQ
jgi:hypothetical protein